VIPPCRILAAVDFSAPSRAALAFASELAGRSGAELHVLHALAPALARAAGTLHTDLIGRTRRDLEAVTRSVCAPERRRRLHVVVGEPAAVICDTALREQVDLAVLGVHGQVYRTNAQLGATARAVVRGITLATMFVPESWLPPGTRGDAVRLGPVIAAVDGRQPSIVAANAAAALASLIGARLELLHVGDQMPLLPAGTRARLTHGDAADAAVALAEAAQPDDDGCPILVMGRRTHGDTLHAPSATVARVVTAARAPVLMYLPDD
jgi:nucleotide-binding universal stress UspA family protein